MPTDSSMRKSWPKADRTRSLISVLRIVAATLIPQLFTNVDDSRGMTVLGPSRIIENIYPMIKRYWVQLDIYAPFRYPIFFRPIGLVRLN